MAISDFDSAKICGCGNHFPIQVYSAVGIFEGTGDVGNVLHKGSVPKSWDEVSERADHIIQVCNDAEAQSGNPSQAPGRL